MSLLSESGYIYSVPGKGSFIRKPNIETHTLHFNELDIIKGHVDNVILLGVKIIIPTNELIRHLKITKSHKVLEIRRLFSSKKGPVAYDIKYLPYDKRKPLVEEVIQYATFPDLVSLDTSLFSLKKELTISAKIAQSEEKQYLKVGDGYPLLVIEQKLYAGDDRPVGWGKVFYRAEYCELQAVSSQNDKSDKK